MKFNKLDDTKTYTVYNNEGKIGAIRYLDNNWLYYPYIYYNTGAIELTLKELKEIYDFMKNL